MRRTPGLLAAALCACVALQAHAQAPWKPQKPIEIAVGSAAGTGTDRTARLIEAIWRDRKAMDVPVIVVNKPGGGSTIAYAYMNQRAGDPHHLLVSSYNLVTANLTGKTPLSYTDFTLISLLISEYICYS